MLTSRRRVALALTAAASAASLLAFAVPAQAAVAPAWPASRLPTGAGCAITSTVPYTASASGQNEYTFTDTAVPTVTNWTVNNQTSVLALAPGTTTATFRILVSQTCGGTGAVASGLIVNGARVSNNFAFGLENTDAFSSVWSTSVPAGPDLAGTFRLPTVNVAQRYASFILKDDWSLSASTPFAGPPTTVTGPWSTKTFSFVRATALSNTLSAAKVKKGKTVKATAVLTMAKNAGYVADAGDKVVVQTKVGTGKWVSNATLTTNSAGVVSYTFVLSATTQVRFLHSRVLSGKFTNGAASVIRTVTKA